MRQQPVIAHANSRLPATHHRTNAIANAFQVKKNSAIIAPTWNAPRKNEVVQLKVAIVLIA